MYSTNTTRATRAILLWATPVGLRPTGLRPVLYTNYCDLRSCAVVCLSVTCLRPAKTAERIDVLLGMKTTGGPRNIVLDWDLNIPTKRGLRRGDAMQSLTNYLDLLLT